jgi:ABC-type multidrug transport system fused ATPase/permease subunit
MSIFEAKTKKIFSIGLALLGKKRALLLLMGCFLIIFLDFLGVALLVPLLKFSQDGSFEIILQTFFGFEVSPKGVLIFVILIFLVFTIIKNFILFLATKYKCNAMFFIQEKLSALVLAEYLRKNFSEFKNITFAQVSRNVISETGHLVSFLINFVDMGIETLVFISISLFVGSRNVALYFFFVLFALIGIIVFQYTKKRMYSLGSVRVTSERIRVSEIQGIYNLFKEIKLYELGSHFIKRYEGPNYEVARSHAIEGSIRPLSKHIYEIATVFFIFIFVSFYYGEKFFYGDLILIIAALFRLFPSFTKVIASLQQIAVHRKSVDGVIEVFYQNDVDYSLPSVAKKKDDNNIESFFYELINLPIGDKTIGGMKIKLDPNDKMVLVRAESGFGKSLLLTCMVGLLEADDVYHVNGKLTSKEEIKKLRLFSLNTQSSQLLNDTIIKNIIFDSSENGVNEEDLERSINISGLTSFLEEASEGLNTILSDKGHNLSGGQQQRITLARTIYKRRPIMILDESLSALDKVAQSEILFRLKKHYPGRVIIVSHDTFDPMFFDKIITYE